MSQDTIESPPASPDTFNPSAENSAWVAREFNAEPAVPAVPVNGQPVTLAEYVDHEAMSYRSQGTPEAAFLAEQLERVSQLIAWVKATTPQEYADRLEVWDQEIRTREFDRGYSEGMDAARRELAVYLPR